MEQEEFARRIEVLKERLYHTAWLYLSSEAAALEAVDEAVYLGLRSLKKLRQPEYFNTWMTRILINECKKELRRMRREQPADCLPEASEDFDYDALPLRQAIGRLPENLRQVVLLRYFTGLTQMETADVLGIPPGTAATRQRRALELLKLDLEEEHV